MLRALAKFFSIFFHPLLIVTYMLLLLLLMNPYQFGVSNIGEQKRFILLVFLSTFAMPAFAVFMMKSLGMVKSMELNDRFERIGPYILTAMFYCWMFINFKHDTLVPRAFVVAVLGATISLFGVFFFNNFTKISAHAAGMGGLVGMVAMNSLFFDFDTFAIGLGPLGAFEVSTNFVLMLVLVLAGIVCTSRLLLGAHNEKQLYGGLSIGFISQFVALLFMR